MRSLNRASIKLFLPVITLVIALSFVLDPSVAVTSSELQASPAAPSQEDLTGTWTSDDMGTYYVRQVGNTVWWMGQSQDGGVSYTNVFNGNRSGDQITGFWADVPAGKYLASGSLNLSISGTGGNVEIRKVRETGGFGPSLWKKRGAAPRPDTEHAQTPHPPGVCTISGQIRNDLTRYNTRVNLYRYDRLGPVLYWTSVQNGHYSILNVPEGSYYVKAKGRWRSTLDAFADSAQEIKCQRNEPLTVDFEIRSFAE